MLLQRQGRASQPVSPPGELPDGRRYPAHVLALAATVPLLLLALPLIGFPDTYVERSAITALPFFLVVAATGLVERQPPHGARRNVTIAAVACLLIQAVQFGMHDYWTVYKPHPDWERAALHLGGRIDGDASGRPLFYEGLNPQPLSYYDPRFQQADVAHAPVRRTSRLLDSIRETFGEDSRIGGFLLDLSQRKLEELAEVRAARWDACEMPLHRLGRGTSEDLLLKARCVDDTFYILFHRVAGERSPAGHPVFSRTDLQVVEETRFRSLWLYEMNWLDWIPGDQVTERGRVR